MKFLNKLPYILIGIFLAIAGTVYAINVTIPQATQKGDLPSGLSSGNYQLLHPGTNGQILSASSTSSTGLAWVANSAAAGATTTIQTGSSGITLNGPNFVFASGTDTNLGLNISGSGSTITFQPTFTGTLAAGRLNSNVVQGVTNDTNVTGTISAQNLTLGWTGNLSVARGGTGTTTWTSGSVPYYNGTNLTENNLKFVWDSTNLWLKAPIADFGGQVYNVKAYGAKGDGSTNDTASFNSAISAAHSAGGGTVFLPTGNYKLSTSPTLFSDIKLSGTGSSSIVTLAAGSKLDTTNLNNIDFRDFSVDGHLQATSTEYGILVSGNSTNVTIDHVRLNTNCFNIFVNAATNTTTSKVSITNIYAKGQGWCDVIGGGPNNSTNARVTDIDFHDNIIVQDDTTGGTDKEAVNLVAANFYNFHDNTTYGGLLFGTEQQPDTDSAIKNNFVHNALGAARAALGVVVQANATTTGSNLSFSDNTIDSGFIDIINNTSAVPLQNLIVHHNIINATGTVTSSGEAGIRISNAKGVIIDHNIVASSSADGVWLTNVTNSKIDTNYVNNSQGVGIKEDGTSNNNEFTNNSLLNNAGGNYSTVGAADTLFTVNNGVGIGTDSPVSLLNLYGSAPVFSINDSGQTWPNGLFQIRDQSKTLQFFNKLLGSSASEVLELSGATTTVTALTVSPTSGGVFNNVQKVYLPSSGNGWFNTGGNFGIGTSTPGYTLTVNGTSLNTATSTFLGNVVIGTSTLQSFINNSSYSNAPIELVGTTTITGNLLLTGNLTTPNNSGTVNIGDSTHNINSIFANSLTIAAINTHTLHAANGAFLVDGASTITLQTNSANTNVFTAGASANTVISPYSSSFNVLLAPNGGNVGIGTTSPVATFSVNGQSYLSGTTTTITALILPVAAASVLGTSGQIAVNTTANTLSFNSGGTQYYLNPVKPIQFEIQNPTTNENDGIFIFNATSTITKVLCVNRGTSDSANINFFWDNDNTKATSSMASGLFSSYQNCNGTSTPTTLTSFASSTINSLQNLRFVTGATASSSDLTITIYYKENQ